MLRITTVPPFYLFWKLNFMSAKTETMRKVAMKANMISTSQPSIECLRRDEES
jgi:hypothetical protein